MTSIGSRIVSRRKELGLKARELAERVGCHPPDISDWEKDKTTPSLASLLKLARALDISETWLLTGREQSLENSGNVFRGGEEGGHAHAVHWRDAMLRDKDTIIHLQQEKIEALQARVKMLEGRLQDKAK